MIIIKRLVAKAYHKIMMGYWSMMISSLDNDNPSFKQTLLEYSNNYIDHKRKLR